MHAAQRLALLPDSAIHEMSRLAVRHQAVNLSQGFPDFDPPPEVLEAAVAALRAGHNQYSNTWGIPELRAKVADKYGRLYGLPVDPDTGVTITCGVTEAILAAFLGLIDPGDKVILIEPFFENYLCAVRAAGGEPVWVPMLPPRFELVEEELRAAFAQKPKAIIVNSPHNPTGRVFSRETLQKIADLCLEHNVIAISDEIYEHILYDGRAPIALATLPGMAERTITVSGLTKTYAVTGWRVAWAVAPPALTKIIRSAHDFITVCAPTPLQVAASVALDLPDDYYTELTAAYQTRRDKIMAILDGAGFQAHPPEGAFYVMADYSAIQPGMDEATFTQWLITEKKVAVVPGSSFYHAGLEREGIVRFAFAKKLETLEAAYERLVG